MSEFADIFKTGLSGLFRNAKEGEENEEEIDAEESEQEEESQRRRNNGDQIEGRAKIGGVESRNKN